MSFEAERVTVGMYMLPPGMSGAGGVTTDERMSFSLMSARCPPDPSGRVDSRVSQESPSAVTFRVTVPALSARTAMSGASLANTGLDMTGEKRM